eukprot:g13741.t1
MTTNTLRAEQGLECAIPNPSVSEANTLSTFSAPSECVFGGGGALQASAAKTIEAPVVGAYGAYIGASKRDTIEGGADGLKRVVLFLGLLLCCVGCVVLWSFTGHAVAGAGAVSASFDCYAAEGSLSAEAITAAAEKLEGDLDQFQKRWDAPVHEVNADDLDEKHGGNPNKRKPTVFDIGSGDHEKGSDTETSEILSTIEASSVVDDAEISFPFQPDDVPAGRVERVWQGIARALHRFADVAHVFFAIKKCEAMVIGGDEEESKQQAEEAAKQIAKFTSIFGRTIQMKQTMILFGFRLHRFHTGLNHDALFLSDVRSRIYLAEAVLRKALAYVGLPADAAKAIATRMRQALRNSLLKQIRSAALKAAAAAAPKFPPHLVDFVSFGLGSDDVSERHAILASGFEAILFSKASWTIQGTQFRWTDQVSGPLYEYDTIIRRSEGSAAAVVRGASTLPSVIKTTLPDGELCPWHVTAYTKYHVAAFEAVRRARRPEQKTLILGASKAAVDKTPAIRKAAQNLGTVVLTECREVAPGTLREHEKPQGAGVTLSHQVTQPAVWQTEDNDEDDMEAEDGAGVEDDNRADDLMSKWEGVVSSTETGSLKKIRSNTRNAFATT